MKSDYRDVVLVGWGLLVTVGLTLAAMRFAAPALARLLGGLYALGFGLAGLLAYGLITAVYLRLVIRCYPLREGVYDLEHPQFLLWKHCAMFGDLARVSLGPLNLAMTRVMYYRLLGAKVGANVGLGRINLTDPWLTVLDDLAVVGDGTTLAAHAITSGRFTLGRVRVRRGATVGVGSFVMPGADIGDNALVTAMSRVNPGTCIPPGEVWEGVPAVKIRGARS